MPFAAFLAIWLGVNLVFATLSAYLASRWGRDPFAWLFTGAVLGPIAFILLFVQRQADARAVRPTFHTPGARLAGAGPKVLVAVDGSSMSDQAVRHVIERFDGTIDEVTLVGVLPIERAEGVTMSEESARKAFLEEEVGRFLAGASSALRGAGITGKGTVRFGDPATEIIRLAQEIDCDLIVMGRRGRGGAAKLLLGSVSEKVSKEAPCPVTVIG